MPPAFGRELRPARDPDHEHCGIATHVIPTRPIPPLPNGVPTAKSRRPRLAFSEPFESFLDADSGPGLPDLNAATFDANGVHISTAASAAFCDHHGVDIPTAIAELRFF